MGCILPRFGYPSGFLRVFANFERVNTETAWTGVTYWSVESVPGQAQPIIKRKYGVHAGHGAGLTANAERVLGMSGLIGEGCASNAPRSIISIAMGTR